MNFIIRYYRACKCTNCALCSSDLPYAGLSTSSPWPPRPPVHRLSFCVLISLKYLKICGFHYFTSFQLKLRTTETLWNHSNSWVGGGKQGQVLMFQWKSAQPTLSVFTSFVSSHFHFQVHKKPYYLVSVSIWFESTFKSEIILYRLWNYKYYPQSKFHPVTIHYSVD